MKPHLHVKVFAFLIAFFLLCNAHGDAQRAIWTLDFEEPGGYSTNISEFSDGSYDFFHRTDGSDIGNHYEVIQPQGSYFFAAQDLDGEGGPKSDTLFIDDINISGISDISLSLLLAEDEYNDPAWDDADYVHIGYDIDNSGNFRELIWIEMDENETDGTNGEPRIDTDYDGQGDGTEINSVFTSFSQAIDQTGDLLDIRIVFTLNSGSEDIAIDSLVVSGTGEGPVPSFAPALNTTGVAIDTNLFIQFDEPVYKEDGSTFYSESDLQDLITLTEENRSGNTVEFTASYHAANQEIIINPVADLKYETTYFLAIDKVYNEDQWASEPDSTIFTTKEEVSVNITKPVQDEKYYAGDSLNTEWSSKNVDQVEIKLYNPHTRRWLSLLNKTSSDGSEKICLPDSLYYSEKYKLSVACTNNNNIADTSELFTIVPTPSIFTIQTDTFKGDSSFYSGQLIKTYGTVTGSNSKGFYLQDTAGIYNGIWVQYPEHENQPGDSIVIEGVIAESGNLTQIQDIAEITVLNENSNLPEPLVTSVTEAKSEEYESTLVSLTKNTGTRCSDTTGYCNTGTWKVHDQSGNIRVKNNLYHYEVPVPDTAYMIDGIIREETGKYSILPRNEDDIAINPSPHIQNVTTAPSEPTAGDDITVTASINDEDGVQSSTLLWGTDENDITNEVDFVKNSESDEYEGTIPGQDTVTTLYFTIKASDGLSTRKYQSQIEQTITAIHEDPQVMVKIYPNPNDGRFTIDMDRLDGSPLRIEVYNIIGKIIYNKEFSSKILRKTIQLDRPEPGIYFIKISGNGVQSIEKIIVR